jgi:hypothetical protein
MWGIFEREEGGGYMKKFVPIGEWSVNSINKMERVILGCGR